MLSRILLSKYFCKLVEIAPRVPPTSINRLLAKGGIKIPFNREIYLLTNLLFSKGYLPVLIGKISFSSDLVDYLYKNYCEPYDKFSIEEALYISKLQSYIQGGDHRIVLCSHAASEVNVALPFTTIALFRFYVNYERSFDYIIRGKGFLEDFLLKNKVGFEKTVSPRSI